MLGEFLKYIEENHLINKGERILLAVSGGIDSMVMTDLFVRSGFETGIAHCNFCLRDKESDKDEKLVRKYAEDHKIPFYTVRFETKKYSMDRGISIQMSARELRYEWFEKIRKENGFDSIAVAHNLNDNIETLLINLTRGTGIAGLTGMRNAGNRIIRPLLFATRHTIEEYCRDRHVKFREDQSNSETKYTRNKIRHLVIPLLKEINPSIEFALNETAERLSGINEIVSDVIENIRKNVSIRVGNNISFDISKLKPWLNNKTVIYELFRSFGISGSNVKDLCKIIAGRTGGQLFTHTHRFLKNRKEIIVSVFSEPENESYIAGSVSELKKIPWILTVRISSVTKSFKIPSGPETACLDLETLCFPLIIRKWRTGDFFYPFGMKQKKKLSDYFTDKKYSRLDKEKTYILESDGKIVWILGERIDNRFRISGNTKKALILKGSQV
ncbi:MAG: tRNA lysidine(34) synthetase TilS [Bacteroidales bacterium]|jgi:tRNA(Ile)-lysidine synthase|nr:tRNA lysidine(34) synthetase TilS [Bacteroidales bacterium]